MIGIDTNILVRVFTKDDPEQARRAAKLISENKVFVSKTVLLETEWVLRYAYELPRRVIHEALKKLFGLPNISLEDSFMVYQAMTWYGQGIDFADALHLGSLGKVDRFASFDKALVKKALKISPVEVFSP